MDNEYEDDTTGSGFNIWTILIILAILLSIASISYNIISPAQDGKPGVQGVQGLQGVNGSIGPQGPKGDRGDTGQQGIQGIQGPVGRNGTDFINHKPTIGNVSKSGSYKNINGTYTFIFNLNTTISDKDNDTVQSMVYYRNNTNNLWKPCSMFFDKNKVVKTSVSYSMVNASNQHLYWCITVFDGCDMVVEYFDYIVMYP